MIYDPDRILYRQFGVSVTAIGLPPGQRRKRVYTSVDLRVTPNPASSSLSDNASMLSMAIAPPLQSSDTDNNTEGDEEGDLDSAGLPTFDNDCVSSDDDASDEGDSCTGEDSTAVTASPLSGGLEVADDGTDKDTELDDLLNYEIHLSQLDIDMDIADTLSVCSEQLYTSESPIKYDQQTCWKDSKSSGETSYEAHRISDLKGEHKNKSLHEEVGKIDKIPEPRRKLKSTKKGLKTAAKGSSTAMLIENYRPFSFGVPLKKPLKRLNFIGAPGKAPDTDRWLSTLNAPNLRDYDSSLDFFDDDDKEESLFGMGAGSVAPHVFSGSGDKTDSTVAQGSQQIKIPRRRASMPRSSKHTSPLEYMYSHQSGDREHFEFNPLVFPPGSDLVVNALNIRDASASSRLMEAVALVKSKGLESHPSEAAIDYVDNSSAAIVSHSSLEVSCADAPTESCPSTPPIPVIVNDQPTIEIISAVNGLYLSPGDNVLSPAGALTPQDNVNQWRSRSSKKGGVIGKYSDNTKKIQADNSQLNVSLRSVDSVLGKQRSPSISISESSAMSLFSTFSAFSMNSVKSAVHFLFSSAARRDEDKSMDSAAHTGALARDRLIAGQLERERAKERQRKKERELERCEVLNAGTSSPLSEFALDADAQQELCRGVGQEPLTVLDGSHPTDPDMDDLLLLPMRFWNTFPNLIDNSARKGRFISAEEELADNEIESEINNFIVPDELSPIILRQYGIEIGMKELNGIRQNALISLPALLSKIGRKSSEDPMEELTESELGLWGADVEPKMFFTAVAAFNDAGNCELLAGIERLISSDSREDPLKYSPGQKRNRPVRPTSFNAVQIAGMGLQTELEMQQQRRIDDGVGSPLLRKTSYVANSDITELLSRREGAFVLNGESVSEKSFLSKNYRDSSATNEVDFAPFSNRASSVEVQDIEISAPLTPEQAEDLILHKEAHLAWSALSAGSLSVSRDLATLLLLKFAEDPESVVEPLETLVLLVDKLGADVNATNENSMTPLHSLFSKPALGRFILSRGGDVLAKDDHGDSVLAMCAEYGYHWVLPAFMNMHGREAKLLEDPERAHEYAVILISIWGFGTRVKELLEEGVVSISSDEALEIMDTCKENFETMKEPVETFELLETLVLKG